MFPQIHTREKKSQSGQSAAELALIAPLFALFVIGIVWAAQYFYTYLSAITAASDCAMLGAQEQASAPTWQGSSAIDHIERSYGVKFRVKVERELGSVEQCVVYVDATGVNQWGFPLNANVKPSYDFEMPFQPYSSSWLER